jgi:catechol 2,3-dioxygenase-like lactoylglutathione lyase family enzyme
MKVVRLLLSLCVPAVVSGLGGPPTIASTGPAFTGAFFALTVADVEASARWYSEKLDLKVVMHSPKQDGAAVTVLEGPGLIVELIEQDGALPLPSAAPATKDRRYLLGIFKVGALVKDFDRTVAMLRARHVEIAFGPYPARANQRANVIIRDNGGNLIQFFGS